jgi:hypothetical protein
MLKFTIILLLVIIPAKIFAQDSTLLRHRIDSMLFLHGKFSSKKFNSEYDSVHYLVISSKRTKEVLNIAEVHYPVLGGKTKWWIYNFTFIDNKIVKISKYNNVRTKDPRRQDAFYYFYNDTLVYREEKGTSIPEINAQRNKGILLREKFKR